MSLTTSAHTPSSRSELLRGLDVQRHVIGALIMRELHTRYGRENIGYLWMLLEPGLLAASVAALHLGQRPHSADVAPVSFALGGYCTFIIFRSIVTRSESALEANQPLLFHRVVTIFDILAARTLLEAISTIATLIVLMSGACALDLAAPPAQPLLVLAAILLVVWFSFAVSMSICAATYVNKAVAKFVHPIMYILMPISGAFFLLDWIPDPYRSWLAWSPLAQIFEMLHTGQFRSVESRHFDPVYIVGWCFALTVIGLFSIRIVRRHVHLS